MKHQRMVDAIKRIRELKLHMNSAQTTAQYRYKVSIKIDELRRDIPFIYA